MSNPKFSIITVCLNSESTIEKTIQSVINQTYPHIEYIIIDGKSADNTLKLIDKYRDHISKIVSEEDNGIYQAMNKGIALATGDFILFLNADDRLLHERVIEYVADIIEENKNTDVDIFHGSVLIYDHAKKNGHVWKSGPVTKFSLYRAAIPHPATFSRKEAFQKNGLFDESYRIAGDYEWTVRALVKNELKFKYISTLVALFFKGGISTNEKSTQMNKKEKRRTVVTHYSKREDIILKIRWRLKKIFGIG